MSKSAFSAKSARSFASKSSFCNLRHFLAPSSAASPKSMMVCEYFFAFASRTEHSRVKSAIRCRSCEFWELISFIFRFSRDCLFSFAILQVIERILTLFLYEEISILIWLRHSSSFLWWICAATSVSNSRIRRRSSFSLDIFLQTGKRIYPWLFLMTRFEWATSIYNILQ